jgi:hypothetical protein
LARGVARRLEHGSIFFVLGSDLPGYNPGFSNQVVSDKDTAVDMNSLDSMMHSYRNNEKLLNIKYLTTDTATP